jgi:hypothetical protein
MKKLRISTTEMEQYRDYLADVIDLETLLRRLRHEEPPSKPMFAGRAWHKMLETYGVLESERMLCDGFTFNIDCDVAIELPPVKELKGTKVYHLWETEVTLVGVVDGMQGNTAIDYKLTARPNPERLADSYQWRVYCVIFNLYKFDYIICHADKTDQDEIRIKDIYSLPLYRYPEIESDVEYMVNLFTVFCLRHLPERIR